MEYRGQQIADTEWNTRYESYRKMCSNDFDMDAEDLQQFLDDLEAKRKELTEKDVQFRNLKYNFYATEFHEYDNGPDTSAECEVAFSYETEETTEERIKRVERAKKYIDSEIQSKEEKQFREELNNEQEIRTAMQILQKHGYKISK